MYCLEMTGLKRNLEQKINKLLEYFPVVLLIGVRQAGKTTYARNCRPSWKYFDLEKGQDFDFIKRDYSFFFREYPQGVIIDEAQNDPQLFNELRGVIDQNRDLKNRFILTGSSSPELLHHTSDTLAGRVAIIEVGTFKINEFLERPLPQFYSIFKKEFSNETLQFLKQLEKVNSINNQFVQNIFEWGGYPEPVLSKLKNQSDFFYSQWMENYYQTYLNRDVRKLFPKLDLIKYRRFLTNLSELSGTIINKADIARNIEVSEVTIKDYLEIAHHTFIWRIIPPFDLFKSKSSSQIKMPKGIFRDSGLNHFLCEINSREKLLRYPRLGQNFEAFVIEEIIKGISSLEEVSRWNYSYYRTRNGAEIDLLISGPFGIIPIEIKFSSHVNLKQLTSIRNFVTEHDLPFGIVINNADSIELLSDKIIQIPVSFI
jgi:predicted AAA+ superfamily ATPase